jgi:hypothetical protein
MSHVSEATLKLTINALDDVPRTVREIHQRIDLWSPRHIQGALCELETQGLAVSITEQGQSPIIIRRRYRRSIMKRQPTMMETLTAGKQSRTRHLPHSLKEDDPGNSDEDYGLTFRADDDAFQAALRKSEDWKWQLQAEGPKAVPADDAHYIPSIQLARG